MSKRLVFISHKHKDTKTARVLGDFLRRESGAKVEVFLSSDPRFTGPRLGNNLDAELRAALARAGVTILLYSGTAPGWDWSYCMFECGFATNASSRLLVVQCGDEAPKPFQDRVSTHALRQDDVLGFVQDYMTDCAFFEDGLGPVTEFERSEPAVKDAADQLFALLSEAVGDMAREPSEWSPWPFVRLQLRGDELASLSGILGEGSIAVKRNAIINTAVVIDSKAADSIFGVGIDDGLPFADLIREWKVATVKPDEDWIDSVCGQIASCVSKRYPVLRDARIRVAIGSSEVVPVVTRRLEYPTETRMEFEVHFFEIRPRSPMVVERMIPRDAMRMRIRRPGVSPIALKDLHGELTVAGVSRLPIVNEQGRPAFVIHKSMIDEFLLQAAFGGGDVGALVLDDLLADTAMRTMFEQGFVCVRPDSTLEEALGAMRGTKDCRDVFVTASGTKEDPVLGWLTNKRLLELT